MAKSVSAEFQREWADPGQRFAVLSAELRRRYYDATASPPAMVLESEPIELDPDYDIVDMTPVSIKTNEAAAEEHAASNLTLYLRNEGLRWSPSNLISGVWKPTNEQPDGFTYELSQVRILYGYRLPDGSFETPRVFTGYVQTLYAEGHSGVAEMRLVGREAVLEAVNAQDAALTLTDQETVEEGDDSRVRFSTGLRSTWGHSNVRLAGVLQVQGVDNDYTIEDAGEADVEAVIVFNVPVPAGVTPTFDCRQWPRNQSVSALAAAICALANVEADERIIEEPQWPAASAFQEIDSQEDWDAAAKSGTNSEEVPGSIALGDRLINHGFETGDFTGWTTAVGGSEIGSVEVQTTHVYEGSYAAKLGAVVAAFSSDTFSASLKIVSAGGTVFASQSLPLEISEWSEYSVDVPATSTPLYLEVEISTTGGSFARIRNNRVLNKVQTVSIRMMVPGSGIGIPEAPAFGFICIDAAFGFGLAESGTFVTEWLDLLAAPVAWGNLVPVGTLNSGSWTFRTQVATDTGSPDSYVSVGSEGEILSNLKRYFRVEGTLNRNASGNGGPVLDKLTVNFFSSDLFIAHADYSGLNGYQALIELAGMGNMALGFKGDGTLFFRNKAVAPTAVLRLDEDNAIERVRVKPGRDERKTLVAVTYGAYYAEYGDTDAGVTGAAAADKRVKTVNASRFAFSNNANIALSMARKIYEEESVDRRRFWIDGRIVPHLDVGDVIEAAYRHTPLLADVIYGDPMQTEPPFGFDDNGPSNVLVNRALVKVVAVDDDYRHSHGRYEGREVFE